MVERDTRTIENLDEEYVRVRIEKCDENDLIDGIYNTDGAVGIAHRISYTNRTDQKNESYEVSLYDLSDGTDGFDSDGHKFRYFESELEVITEEEWRLGVLASKLEQ